MLLESKVAPKITITDGSYIIKNFFFHILIIPHILLILSYLEKGSQVVNGLDSYCTSRKSLLKHVEGNRGNISKIFS